MTNKLGLIRSTGSGSSFEGEHSDLKGQLPTGTTGHHFLNNSHYEKSFDFHFPVSVTVDPSKLASLEVGTKYNPNRLFTYSVNNPSGVQDGVAHIDGLIRNLDVTQNEHVFQEVVNNDFVINKGSNTITSFHLFKKNGGKVEKKVVLNGLFRFFVAFTSEVLENKTDVELTDWLKQNSISNSIRSNGNIGELSFNNTSSQSKYIYIAATSDVNMGIAPPTFPTSYQDVETTQFTYTNGEGSYPFKLYKVKNAIVSTGIYNGLIQEK